MTTLEWLITSGIILAGIPAITLVGVILAQFWPNRPWRRLAPAVASLQQIADPTRDDVRAAARALFSTDVKLASPEAGILFETLANFPAARATDVEFASPEAEPLMKSPTASVGPKAVKTGPVPPGFSQVFAGMDWINAELQNDPPQPKGMNVRGILLQAGVLLLKLLTTGAAGPANGHHKDKYQIITVVYGSLRVGLLGREYILNPDMYLVVPPNVDHSVWSLEATESYSYLIPQEVYRARNVAAGS